MKVNVHGHVIPETSGGTAGDVGPEYSVDETGFHLRFGRLRLDRQMIAMKKEAETVGMHEAARRWWQRYSDPKIRLKEMDQKGFDVMGVSISPIVYGYDLPPDVGMRHARGQNERLSEYCAADPSRLFFMSTLPMQDPHAAAREVDYSVRELGAKGVNIGVIGGLELDSPKLDPMWNKIEENAVPVMIHPGYHQQKEGEAYDKWTSTLGYPYQGTLAFTSIIYGGVLDRFPGLKLYITHGGGFAPYQFGRIDRFKDAYGLCNAKRPLEEYLPHFFYDILIHQVRARQFLVDWAGADQCIVGDNYEGVDSADGFALLDELNLSAADKEKIAGGNAAALFKLVDVTAK
jgi:aminocarboxymuconate-semialdehyde decarboxylase